MTTTEKKDLCYLVVRTEINVQDYNCRSCWGSPKLRLVGDVWECGCGYAIKAGKMNDSGTSGEANSSGSVSARRPK